MLLHKVILYIGNNGVVLARKMAKELPVSPSAYAYNYPKFIKKSYKNRNGLELELTNAGKRYYELIKNYYDEKTDTMLRERKNPCWADYMPVIIGKDRRIVINLKEDNEQR